MTAVSCRSPARQGRGPGAIADGAGPPPAGHSLTIFVDEGTPDQQYFGGRARPSKESPAS